MTPETWIAIPHYEGYYEASSLGNIRRIKNSYGGRDLPIKEPRILKPTKQKNGYLTITLSMNCHSKSFLVHLLVLRAFFGEAPDKYQASHLNGVRDDNRLDNLIWESRIGNNARKKFHGTYLLGENCSSAKMTTEKVLQMRKMKKEKTVKELAVIFGLSPTTVQRITSKRTWKHV